MDKIDLNIELKKPENIAAFSEELDTKLVKNGNSLAINIPAFVKEKYGLYKGQQVLAKLDFIMTSKSAAVFDKVQKLTEELVKKFPTKDKIDESKIMLYFIMKGYAQFHKEDFIKSLDNLEKKQKEDLLKIHKFLDLNIIL